MLLNINGNEGIIRKMAKPRLSRDFRMNKDMVGRVVKRLGLPERLHKNNPLIALKPIDTDSKKHDVIMVMQKKPVDEKPVVDDDFKRPVKPKTNNFSIIPTLREIEIRNRKTELIKAEADYKNKGKVSNRLT
jgi:hypothetical protein